MIQDAVEPPSLHQVLPSLHQFTMHHAKPLTHHPVSSTIPPVVLHVLWNDILGEQVPLTPKYFYQALQQRTINHPHEQPLWEFATTLIHTLSTQQKTHAQAPSLTMARDYLKADTLGYALQKETSKRVRKAYSMNYSTSLAVKEIQNLLVHELLPQPIRSIMDPFCGSGRLITATLKTIPTKDLEEIIIADVMPMAVLIAFTRVYTALKELGIEKQVRIIPLLGDTFQIFQDALKLDPQKTGITDLIIMNPPFTRIHSMPKHQITRLRRTFKHVLSLHNLHNGQAGLHVYALLLSHYLLRTNGTLISVLPASTISADYATPLKSYLLDSFTSIKFLSPIDTSSFSDASGFREIIMYAQKQDNHDRHPTLTFIRSYTRKDNRSRQNQEYSRIPASIAQTTKNWMQFFVPSQALEIYTALLKSELLLTGHETQWRLVRGVEMYGPHFFFLPNKHWTIIHEHHEHIHIEHNPTKTRILFPKKYLTPIIRKPSNYMNEIIPQKQDYAITIPKNNRITRLPSTIQKYITVSRHETTLAQRKFGEHWIHHIHQQLQTKQPYGHVFLVDKVGIRTSPTLCYYTEHEMPCTKNFHVFTNLSHEDATLLAAWMNSSFFLLLFIIKRREIGGSYGRLQLSDLKEQPFFLDFSKLTPQEKQTIIQAFRAFTSTTIPPLKDQLFWKPRMTLDQAFLAILSKHLDNTVFNVDDLHEILAQLYVEIQLRDKKKN